MTVIRPPNRLVAAVLFERLGLTPATTYYYAVQAKYAVTHNTLMPHNNKLHVALHGNHHQATFFYRRLKTYVLVQQSHVARVPMFLNFCKNKKKKNKKKKVPDDGFHAPQHLAYCCVTLKCCV